MAQIDDESGAAGRLEELWRGEFGTSYTERNAEAGGGRALFWDTLLTQLRPARALEVGCNVGANLVHVARHVPVHDVWGLDVNDASLEVLRSRQPRVNATWGVARALPFRDGWFDLVFTVAVLIHQPADTLPLVLAELVRCAKRNVLCIEYTAAETVEVDYRGQKGAFFLRDYGRLMACLFPELRLVREGVVTKNDGFDDGLGYWLFERP